MDDNQWDKYAKIFDEGIGNGDENLHKNFIDPLIFKYLENKNYDCIADLGCGNGYLLNKLSNYTDRVTGLDYSKKLIEIAKERTKSNSKVILRLSDLNKSFNIDSLSCDAIIANMVLQYLPKLDVFGKEASRVLKKDGVLIVVIDHPGHSLFLRAQALIGKEDPHFITSGSYFTIEKRTKKSLWDKAILEYYHRPISSYINSFLPYFSLVNMDEVTQDGEMPRLLGLKFIKK